MIKQTQKNLHSEFSFLTASPFEGTFGALSGHLWWHFRDTFEGSFGGTYGGTFGGTFLASLGYFFDLDRIEASEISVWALPRHLLGTFGVLSSLDFGAYLGHSTWI